MKILLVGNYLNDRQESMQRFAAALQSGLQGLGHEVTWLRPPVLCGRLKPAQQGFGKWLGYIDKLLIFPFILRKQCAAFDVVHICDHANAPYLWWVRSKPTVITCNDLIAIKSALGHFEGVKVKPMGRLLQRAILHALRHARHIACISQNTRQDLMAMGNVSASVAFVIYMGLNYPYTKLPAPEVDSTLRQWPPLAGRPFIVHVGNGSWYKNRKGVLDIFERLCAEPPFDGFCLVLVGAPLADELQRRIDASPLLSARVLHLGKVDNPGLQALYCAARFLLFPSLYEGFGWPVIEAQACGCPVVTSNRASLTEITEGTALYIDPQHPDQAAAAIAAWYRDSEAVRQLAALGHANSQRFATEAMLVAYVAAYQQAIAEF